MALMDRESYETTTSHQKIIAFYKGFPTDGHSLESDNCTWDLDVHKAACAAHDNGDERGDL
jgi:hypothetical protein